MPWDRPVCRLRLVGQVDARFPVSIETFQTVSIGVLVNIFLDCRLSADREAPSDTGIGPFPWLTPAEDGQRQEEVAQIMRGRDQKGEVKRWTELAGFSFKAAKTRRGPCLFPVEPPCTTKTCEAHSIQNRTVLDALAEEGHVVMLRT